MNRLPMDSEDALKQLFDHFSQVIGPTMDRIHMKPQDPAERVLYRCAHELMNLNESPMALGVTLLLGSRVNGAIRPLIETMLLHVDEQKQKGVWP